MAIDKNEMRCYINDIFSVVVLKYPYVFILLSKLLLVLCLKTKNSGADLFRGFSYGRCRINGNHNDSIISLELNSRVKNCSFYGCLI